MGTLSRLISANRKQRKVKSANWRACCLSEFALADVLMLSVSPPSLLRVRACLRVRDNEGAVCAFSALIPRGAIIAKEVACT
jgi:hypothetical protein